MTHPTSSTQLVTLIRERVAATLGVSPEQVATDERFRDQGLESRGALKILRQLSEALDGRAIPQTAMWDHPTAEQLARFLAEGGSASTGQPSTEVEQPLRSHEPIAVVGIGCRYPGGIDSPSTLWQALRDKVDGITEVPSERWDVDEYFDPDISVPGRMTTRWGGFLDRVGDFDCAFFGISPKEAQQMDPQQRLILEVAWEALEDAAIQPKSLIDSDTGVYVGAMWSDYMRLTNIESIGPHSAVGLDSSIIPARVAYFLGLRGPAIAVNTACSSSLLAVHLACRALRGGDVSLALAGGVNLILAPDSTVAMTKFGGMSPTGRCRSFDAGANGYVRGEAVGMVALKRVSRAIVDGNPIYAVLRGSATNNDGYSNGLTAPSGRAQELVIEAATRDAGVDRADVHYVETHGPGTILGDPIEAHALGRVYGAASGRQQPLRIGSIKSNFGHTEAAAGISGLIKTSLCLYHGAYVGNLHFDDPNPHIDFDAERLCVQTSLEPMAAPVVRAGVSSFGFGGTNVHAILESQHVERSFLVAISGDTEAELQAAAREKIADLAMASASEARQLRRAHALAGRPARAHAALKHGLVFEDADEAVAGLTKFARGGIADVPPFQQTVFVYSATGSVWANMGLSLMATAPVFRSEMLRHDQLIRQIAGWSLMDELVADEAHTRLSNNEFMQPAVVAVQLALTAQLDDWGVVPDVVLGHSLGEVAAAAAAGILAKEEALRIAVIRGQQTQRIAGDHVGMLIVALSADEVGPWLGGGITVAAYNSPRSTVLSGPTLELDQLTDKLTREDIDFARIRASYASHSANVDPILQDFGDSIGRLFPQPGRIRLVSSSHDHDTTWRSFDAMYWRHNLRRPVRFAQALDHSLAGKASLVVEIAPHPVLSRDIRECIASRNDVELLPSMRRNEPPRKFLLDIAAASLRRGAALDWDGIVGAAQPDSPPDAQSAYPLLVSATSADALVSQARALRTTLADRPDLSLRDVSYTLAARRTAFNHRAAFVASHGTEAIQAIDSYIERVASGEEAIEVAARRPQAGFVFTGQGAGHVGMGRELARARDVFGRALRHAVALADDCASDDIFSRLFFSDDDVSSERLLETHVVQPALVALEYALWREWLELGIEPSAVIGHSLGEISCAIAAGVLSVEDGIRFAVERGRLMHRAPGGAMIAIRRCDRNMLEDLVSQHSGVHITGFNATEVFTLAGSETSVAKISGLLEQRGAMVRQLAVRHPFHTPAMRELADELESFLAGLSWSRPKLPFISTVTGTLVDDNVTKPSYWVEQLLSPVRFADAITTAAERGISHFLEVGPHPVLSGLIAATVREVRRDTPVIVGCMSRNGSEVRTLMEAVGRLFVGGAQFNGGSIVTGQAADLATYRMQRGRFWNKPSGKGRPPIRRLQIAGRDDDIIQCELEAFRGWFHSRSLQGRNTVTELGVAELAITAARTCGIAGDVALEFARTIEFSGDDESVLQIQFHIGTPSEDGNRRPTTVFASWGDDSWVEVAQGFVGGEAEPPTHPNDPALTAFDRTLWDDAGIALRDGFDVPEDIGFAAPTTRVAFAEAAGLADNPTPLVSRVEPALQSALAHQRITYPVRVSSLRCGVLASAKGAEVDVTIDAVADLERTWAFRLVARNSDGDIVAWYSGQVTADTEASGPRKPVLGWLQRTTWERWEGVELEGAADMRYRFAGDPGIADDLVRLGFKLESPDDGPAEIPLLLGVGTDEAVALQALEHHGEASAPGSTVCVSKGVLQARPGAALTGVEVWAPWVEIAARTARGLRWLDFDDERASLHRLGEGLDAVQREPIVAIRNGRFSVPRWTSRRRARTQNETSHAQGGWPGRCRRIRSVGENGLTERVVESIAALCPTAEAPNSADDSLDGGTCLVVGDASVAELGLLSADGARPLFVVLVSPLSSNAAQRRAAHAAAARTLADRGIRALCIQIGPYHLDLPPDMPPGAYGSLSHDELDALLRVALVEEGTQELVAAKIQRRRLRRPATLEPPLYRTFVGERLDAKDADSLAGLPRHDRQRRLTGIVRSQAARVLGIAEANQLALEQPLVEQGMDSLLLVRLHGLLENVLGRAVSMVDAGSSVIDVAHRLADELDGAKERTAGSRPTIKLRSGEASPIIVMLPGATGRALYMRQLAEQLPGYDIYAVESAALQAVDDTSMSSLCIRHQEALSELRDRPMVLVGHSFGGVVARELAVSLENDGWTVPMVVAIDSAPPAENGGFGEWDDARLFWFLVHCTEETAGRDHKLTLDELRRMSQSERREAAAARLVDIGAIAPGSADAQLRDMVAALGRNISVQYTPSRAPQAPFILLRCNDSEIAEYLQRPSLAEDLLLGWSQVAEPPQVKSLPGGHLSCLMSPHLAELAASIRTLLHEHVSK